MSISLPNKGGGHSGTIRNWWENICPPQKQRIAQVNLVVIVFPVAPKMVQVWKEKAPGLGGEGSGVGGQDRIGSPCVNQETLGPICHIQLDPWLHPRDGYL